MGIPDHAPFPVSPLSSIQPNPLRQASTSSYDGAAKLVSQVVAPSYDALQERGKTVIDVDEDQDLVKKPPRKRRKATDGETESRCRVFRKKMPQKSQNLLDRALGSPFYVIERVRTGSQDCPEEEVDLAGTTGNIYKIHIKKQPTCTCPAYQKTISEKTGFGDECKHILWVLHRVLRAPTHLQYQLAFLTSELREIFDNAPPIPSASPSSASDSSSNNRKPIDDDCPICCCPFETPESSPAGATDADVDIVWCRAACGNNVHRTCFEQWAATKKVSQGAPVTCPFCRAPWQGDEDSIRRIAKCGVRNAEGYVNVAEELGISTERDYSTYHQPWVRVQQKAGNIPRYY